jgi:hypothetical protein
MKTLIEFIIASISLLTTDNVVMYGGIVLLILINLNKYANRINRN